MLESTPNFLAEVEPCFMETCASNAKPLVVKLDEYKITASDKPYVSLDYFLLISVRNVVPLITQFSIIVLYQYNYIKPTIQMLYIYITENNDITVLS